MMLITLLDALVVFTVLLIRHPILFCVLMLFSVSVMIAGRRRET